MKEFLINVLQSFGLAWWVKIETRSPACTYYFGPFGSEKEAQQAKPGYVEDLMNEEAQGISVNIVRCKRNANNLTIFDDLGEQNDLEGVPTLRGQLS